MYAPYVREAIRAAFFSSSVHHYSVTEGIDGNIRTRGRTKLPISTYRKFRINILKYDNDTAVCRHERRGGLQLYGKKQIIFVIIREKYTISPYHRMSVKQAL